MDKRYLESIFFPRVDKHGPECSKAPGRCWTWTGYKNKDGYGEFLGKGGVRYLAHRISVFIHSNALNDSLYVLHKCDNPPCVNPEHLFQGTAKDNYEDAVAKGRIKTEDWHKPHWRISAEQEAHIVKRCQEDKKVLHETIAKEIGISREIVSKYARQHGFHRNLTDDEKAEIKRLSAQGMHPKAIAQQLGRERTTVGKFLSRSKG